MKKTFLTVICASSIFAAFTGSLSASANGSQYVALGKEDIYLSNYYDKDWHVGFGWPGDVPPGFTISAPGVEVPAHRVPVPNTDPATTCALPMGASIHPWNHRRTKSDTLTFLTASQETELQLNQSRVLKAGADQKITLSKGSRVRILRYLDHEFGEVQINGKPYTTRVSQFEGIATPTSGGYDEHYWVRLTCSDPYRTQAWVRLSEALATPGVMPTQVREYGNVSDNAYQPPYGGNYQLASASAYASSSVTAQPAGQASAYATSSAPAPATGPTSDYVSSFATARATSTTSASSSYATARSQPYQGSVGQTQSTAATTSYQQAQPTYRSAPPSYRNGATSYTSGQSYTTQTQGYTSSYATASSGTYPPPGTATPVGRRFAYPDETITPHTSYPPRTVTRTYRTSPTTSYRSRHTGQP